MNPDLFYNRQLLLIGKAKQKIIANKTIALIGVGGLGSPIAMYLARIGLKNLIIVDNDIVDESNLSRQVLYDFKDQGKKKVDVAYSKLKQFCNLEKYHDLTKVDYANVDLIIGAIDNWKTRYKLNDIALKYDKLYLDITVEGFGGHLAWFNKEHCLSCVFSKKDSTKKIAIVNTSCAFASSIALTQIFQYLVDEKTDFNSMIYFDAKTLKIEKFKIKQKKNCSCVHKS